MAKYVDVEVILRELEEACAGIDLQFPRGRAVKEAIDTVKNHISAMPATDVAPVVHGCWELIRGGEFTSAFKCSVCGRRVCVSCDSEKTLFYLKDRYPYCNCGAKMNGERPT